MERTWRKHGQNVKRTWCGTKIIIVNPSADTPWNTWTLCVLHTFRENIFIRTTSPVIFILSRQSKSSRIRLAAYECKIRVEPWWVLLWARITCCLQLQRTSSRGRCLSGFILEESDSSPSGSDLVLRETPGLGLGRNWFWSRTSIRSDKSRDSAGSGSPTWFQLTAEP